MTRKEEITRVRRAAVMHAHGFSAGDILKRFGVTSRTLYRWQESFVWSEALDFIGFDGERSVNFGDTKEVTDG